jgi:hypothetical protein
MARATNTASLIPAQPTGGDEAVLAAQAAEQFDNPKTNRTADRPFVIGEAASKYLFRSVKGVLRDAKLRMDVKEDWWEDPQDDDKSSMNRQNAKVFLQGWKRRNKSAERQQLLDDALMDNGGEPVIRFIKAPAIGRSDGSGIEDNSKIEVYYQTDSDAIATLIREAIAEGRGDFRFIYEVDQSTHLKVGDKRFARTPVGLQMAHDYMRQSGETSMELEAKAS